MLGATLDTRIDQRLLIDCKVSKIANVHLWSWVVRPEAIEFLLTMVRHSSIFSLCAVAEEILRLSAEEVSELLRRIISLLSASDLSC